MFKLFPKLTFFVKLNLQIPKYSIRKTAKTPQQPEKKLTKAEQMKILNQNAEDAEFSQSEIKQLLKEEQRENKMFDNVIYESSIDDLDRDLEKQI